MAARRVVMRMDGRLIELSEDGETPLTGNIERRIKLRLQFDLVKLDFTRKLNKRGKNLINTEHRRLYAYDAGGRLICQRGWKHALLRLLNELGCEVEVIDLYEMSSPDCFDENWDNVLDAFEFRPQQEQCLLQVASHIRERCGGIIDAVPAVGKTAIIAMLCLLYENAKIDVITTGTDLVTDIYRLILRHTPSVGMVGCGQNQTDRITVYSADSLHYADFRADLVFADECHKLVTDRLAERMGSYLHALKFGFTATKDARCDNAHKQLEGLFGPTIFKLTWQQATKLGLVVPLIVQWVDVDMGYNPVEDCQTLVAKKRHAFWRNAFRNNLVAHVAQAYRALDMQVLILVETIEHVLYLKQFLPDFEVCYSEGAMQRSKNTQTSKAKAEMLASLPKMTASRRHELRNAFMTGELRGCIANTVWSEGVSFDGLQVLIRADGGSSELNNQQWPGRVARIDPATGKQFGILVDFRDQFDYSCENRAKTRARTYKKNGWTQQNWTMNGCITTNNNL